MKIDLSPAFKQQFSPKQRKVGRYSVSDIWAMLNDYLPPQDYLKLEEYSVTAEINKWQGTTKHREIQALWLLLNPEDEVEKKVEKKIGDFIVVGKADIIHKNVVLEIKTSMDLLFVSKRWHDYQLQWYLNLFEKDKGYIAQPTIKTLHNKPVAVELSILKTIYHNPTFFEREVEKLTEYHNQLLKLK
jgi:hypothetical protein